MRARSSRMPRLPRVSERRDLPLDYLVVAGFSFSESSLPMLLSQLVRLRIVVGSSCFTGCVTLVTLESSRRIAASSPLTEVVV